MARKVLTLEEGMQMVQDQETGPRRLVGTASTVIRYIALSMSIFHIYTGLFGELAGSQQLSVHLMFGLVLCYLCFPGSKRSRRDRLDVQDVILSFLAGAAAIYMFFNYEHVARSVGQAALYDYLIGGVLMVLILEAARRSVSPLLPLITVIFLLYAYFGSYMPGELAHRGFTIKRIVDHAFMTGEGLWGVALRVSATFVFLFVAFGAFLDKIGTGEYLISMAFAMMGRFRGGPAKAAVVASAAFGTISGSSIANTVTVGSMTIPLMKKVGFKPHVAGAVEVASSVHGQLMPPVMGAAAFIMAEMIGVSYYEICLRAIVPAVLTYLTIFFIVDIEAVKNNIKGLPKGECPPFFRTLFTGFHYIVPLFVLVFLLLVFFWTPGTSAAWSIVSAILLAVFNNFYRARVRFPKGPENDSQIGSPYAAYQSWLANPDGFALRRSWVEVRDALETGARNMAGVAAACACCGMIISVVTLTGLGLKMATFITVAAGDNLLLILFFCAVASIILGMGVPTTATYIIMAAMTAPALSAISQDQNLGIPIVAIHLFVFYFGIVADDTPPVGLAAYAAAGIAGSDPIRTGWKSFQLDSGAFTLPFMFIYNPMLLGYGATWADMVYIIPMAIVGMMCWSVFIQGYWLVKTNIAERFLYPAVAFVLVNPGNLVIGPISINAHMANIGALVSLGLLFVWQRARSKKLTAGELLAAA
jgi:TRAP transporter 4TM/12TM fusion protein